MRTLTSVLLAAIVVGLNLPQARAAISPLAISLASPVQFPPSDFNITGARLSLYGRQRAVYGIDVGVFANVTDIDFLGLAVSGLFNITHGTTTVLGLQLAGLGNINTQKTSVLGLQAALLFNQNTAESSVTGVQLALANLSEHSKIYGLQVGIYNRAESIYGFQIGLVNDVNNLHGVQIGLLNYNRTGLLAVSPLINVGF